MEMGCAKLLDEACNCNNEAYCDELLYAQWLGAPYVGAALLAPTDRADAVPAGLYARRQ